MNINKKIIAFAVPLLAALGLSGPAWAVNVTLEVDDSTDPPRLVVVNNTARCPGGPIDCIEVSSGQQPHMYFRLNRACQPGGTEWGLSRFYVMEQEKVWPASLAVATADEFCADPNTGEVDMGSCGNQARDNQLKVKNYNRNAGTVYYMVEAAHCTDSGRRPIGLDPEIRNKGGN